MSLNDWHPSASIHRLKERANLLKAIRRYFDEREVMEVETPMMSSGATVDLYIESFATKFLPLGSSSEQCCYLHTSPEFPMKRLLAAGSGDIYSLGKVFRNGESGGRHNPEFTMLEYYRVGMDQQQLMDDLSQLLATVADYEEVDRLSYRDVFMEYLEVNPHQISDQDLLTLVHQHIDCYLSDLDRNDCFDLLFSKIIEPNLGNKGKVTLNGFYVYDYPASMAALARKHINEHSETVAARFELFINGVELANGYHELVDGHEQQQRFESEQKKRKESDRPVYPYDHRLVSALKHGMPESAGVAMGIDRLMMLMVGTGNIADVIAFDFHRA